MDIPNLLVDLARLPWVPPHLIPTVSEEHEEALLPLDELLMLQLPPLNIQEIAPPVRNPVPVAGPIESHFRMNEPEDWRPWKEYDGMDYVGVQEELIYEWAKLEFQPEENAEDDITSDSMSSQKGPMITATHATKRPVPLSNDNILLQSINPSAPHIPTIGLCDSSMPDASPPTFGPILEPVPHQQQVDLI